MADQIKIRAQNQGEITDIRILMQHPMETGQRKDDKGQSLPMHFIQTFTVNLNGKPIIDGQLNTSISKNPLFTFNQGHFNPKPPLCAPNQSTRRKQRRNI